MGLYKIIWKKTAIKELRKIPKQYIKRIIKRIEYLSDNPYPNDVVKIVSEDQSFRIRISDYRIIYRIINNIFIIEIIRIKHRKDVYK